MWLFRVLFAFDALVLLVLSYFFVDGLQYGGTSALWLLILGVPIAVLTSAWILGGKGRQGMASALLGIVAAPALMFALFFGLLIILNPSWQ